VTYSKPGTKKSQPVKLDGYSFFWTGFTASMDKKNKEEKSNKYCSRHTRSHVVTSPHLLKRFYVIN